MDNFIKELRKILRKRLPQSMEYGWSRRIEGALERSEDSAPHEYVTIMIDGETEVQEYDAIKDTLYEFLKNDEFFKRSNYRVLLWKDNQFFPVSPKRVSQMSHLKRYLDQITIETVSSGKWDDFWEIYKPHKRAGQVILITCKEKAESLNMSKVIGIKNLVVIYVGDENSKTLNMVKTIPCIAYCK